MNIPKPLLFLLIFIPQLAHAQINPENVTIARDSWGVPHIFAKTDPEVAYGLAYAHGYSHVAHHAQFQVRTDRLACCGHDYSKREVHWCARWSRWQECALTTRSSGPVTHQFLRAPGALCILRRARAAGLYCRPLNAIYKDFPVRQLFRDRCFSIS